MIAIETCKLYRVKLSPSLFLDKHLCYFFLLCLFKPPVFCLFIQCLYKVLRNIIALYNYIIYCMCFLIASVPFCMGHVTVCVYAIPWDVIVWSISFSVDYMWLSSVLCAPIVSLLPFLSSLHNTVEGRAAY